MRVELTALGGHLKKGGFAGVANAADRAHLNVVERVGCKAVEGHHSVDGHETDGVVGDNPRGFTVDGLPVDSGARVAHFHHGQVLDVGADGDVVHNDVVDVVHTGVGRGRRGVVV